MPSKVLDPTKNTIAVRDYFGELKANPDRSFVGIAEAIERKARIEDHPFFAMAKKNREALVLWASQEAIVTNPFSQILFRVISNVKNVHVRSILLPVVHGEHSVVRQGIAAKSHPWLIWRLCRSLGISEEQIHLTRAIRDFVAVLEDSADEPMKALGVLGIGNELMLLAEYGAVEACFDAACPEADYREFLRATMKRAGLYVPWLRQRTPLDQARDPVVGIRPCRRTGVRVEIDHSVSSVPVVHNYGHGGSGFSLSWGCANAVVDLVDRSLGG